jgi:hypothetical protein
MFMLVVAVELGTIAAVLVVLAAAVEAEDG